MFAIQFTSGAYKLALSQGMADFGALSLRINNPDDLCSTTEEVTKATVYLLAGIVWRKDFNRKIWRTRKELFRGWLKTQSLKPRFGNERNIGRATVAVDHPMSRAGSPDHSQAMGAVKIIKGRKQAAKDAFVLIVIFRAHDQFAIHDFVDVSILWEGLQIFFRPHFLTDFCDRSHDSNLVRDSMSVEHGSTKPGLLGSQSHSLNKFGIG